MYEWWWFFQTDRSGTDGRGEPDYTASGSQEEIKEIDKEPKKYSQYIYEEYLPHALTMGVPYELFWHLNPKKIKAFEEAYKLKRKVEDEQMWLMGMYVNNAVSVAIDHALNGRKAKSKYFEKPIMEQVKDNNPDLMTEEEKLERVKLLFATLEARKIEFDRENNKGSN